MNLTKRRAYLYSFLTLCISTSVHSADDPALMQKRALVDARQHHAAARAQPPLVGRT